MVFEDEPKALHLLQNISYYRLSGYWYPLLTDKQQHIFKPGSTFETAYNIYKFDSELRKLIIAEIEKIEVAITSFGTLSILYENLLPGKIKRSIAAYFGLPDKVFASWLHSVVYVRNICAHHSRLWNKTLSIRPLMPRSPRNTFIKLPASGTPQVYFILSMIIYLLNTINPNHSIISRFNALLSRYPTIDVRAMGFPDDWKNESLWKDK